VGYRFAERQMKRRPIGKCSGNAETDAPGLIGRVGGMIHLIVTVISFLLAMVFAAAWGAHIFETAVIYSVQASDPPQSLADWVATPAATKVPGFWRRLVPGLYTAATIAVAVSMIMGVRMQLALAIAGVCAFIHLTMNVLIFLPINTKLGFYSAGKSAPGIDPHAAKTLVRRWGRWNYVRLGVETAGLIAAIFAFRAA
jgi:hypothetical protein